MACSMYSHKRSTASKIVHGSSDWWGGPCSQVSGRVGCSLTVQFSLTVLKSSLPSEGFESLEKVE